MPEYQSQAEQAAAIAQKVMQEQRAARRNIKVPVVGSQGRIVDAAPYLDDKYKSQQMAILWADLNEHPEKYLKNPEPGYHYGFIGMKDLSALGRVRSTRYAKVEPKEMNEQSELPWSTHKSPTGEMVLVYDTYMVKISPQVWQEDYKGREGRAMSQLAGAYEAFYSGVESAGGKDPLIQTKDTRPGS